MGKTMQQLSLWEFLELLPKGLVLALPWQHPVTNGLLVRTKHEGSYFPKYASKSLTEHICNNCSLLEINPEILQTFISYEPVLYFWF